MIDYVYRATVRAARQDGRLEILVDLGFRVYRHCAIGSLDSSQRYPIDTNLLLFVYRADDGTPTFTPEPADDPDGEVLLWHYPARVLRVIDGDTLDARVDLGFATTIDERFRLADIDAPGIFGVPADSPERERGLAARAFVAAGSQPHGGDPNRAHRVPRPSERRPGRRTDRRLVRDQSAPANPIADPGPASLY